MSGNYPKTFVTLRGENSMPPNDPLQSSSAMSTRIVTPSHKGMIARTPRRDPPNQKRDGYDQ